MTAEEKSELLKAYHPDFRPEGFKEIKIGPNKGQKAPVELVDLLHSNSRLLGQDIDLGKVDYDVDVLVIGGGGAVYAWSLHQQNERRRQAVRAQQARQAQSRQNQAQQPQMRMAPPAAQQTRSYNPQVPQQTGSYAPVRPQQPASPQNTQAFRPQQPAAPQNTQAFQPQQSPQNTQAFRPQQPAAPQNTQASKPPVPTQTAPAGESTAPRRRRSDKYNS